MLPFSVRIVNLSSVTGELIGHWKWKKVNQITVHQERQIRKLVPARVQFWFEIHCRVRKVINLSGEKPMKESVTNVWCIYFLFVQAIWFKVYLASNWPILHNLYWLGKNRKWKWEGRKLTPCSSKSGISSLRAFGSIQAPDNVWRPEI